MCGGQLTSCVDLIKTIDPEISRQHITWQTVDLTKHRVKHSFSKVHFPCVSIAGSPYHWCHTTRVLKGHQLWYTLCASISTRPHTVGLKRLWTHFYKSTSRKINCTFNFSYPVCNHVKIKIKKSVFGGLK